jgi:hypothetical protein
LNLGVILKYHVLATLVLLFYNKKSKKNKKNKLDVI